MTSLPDLLQQSTAHAWLFVPTAILLGALHGLEPGHSKTMMAAFIIAIRGTVMQAILLGVTAAISHTAVVWVVALGGQYLGRDLDAEQTEPYLQLASAVIVLGVAAWMVWRTWKSQRAMAAEHHHGHDHDHHPEHAHPHNHSSGLDLKVATAYADDHERSHAQDIARRFKDSKVSTGQIVIFGLTGGLIPCPAAITVLLLCLQLKQLTLGAVLVLCFSIGLAITMVAAGVFASLSVRHIQKRWSGFSAFAARAPYASAALMLLIAVYMGVSGWNGLAHHL
ncbi:MAG: nickel/cobalt efflux transporter RcnA [Xanthobacteraceae bacterium]|nr:nickel/cobalt efflux transporter RcnA [Xanthobacteraceae bacterium]